MTVSLIVSAYNRPDALECCLASLACQTYADFEVVVACNAQDGEMKHAHSAAVSNWPAARLYFTADGYGTQECYDSAEVIVRNGLVRGEWIGFPSDDGYQTPNYLSNMMAAVTEHKWDFVYCDMLLSSFWLRDGSGPTAIRTDYLYENIRPEKNHIDKTCFLVKMDLFREIGFPGKIPGKACAADGELAEALVRRGIRHGKARGGAMVVHS